MVNPIVSMLLELRDTNDKDILASFRRVSTGGVRLPTIMRDSFREMLHHSATMRQVYGMTEIGWAISLLYPEDDVTGTAGKLLPGVKAK